MLIQYLKDRTKNLKAKNITVVDADFILITKKRYAIAFKYISGLDEAPYIITKGKDSIAQSIKDIGLENNIPLIENPKLAKAIYKTIPIGQIITDEYYPDVAEIYHYIDGLDKK